MKEAAIVCLTARVVSNEKSRGRRDVMARVQFARCQGKQIPLCARDDGSCLWADSRQRLEAWAFVLAECEKRGPRVPHGGIGTRGGGEAGPEQTCYCVVSWAAKRHRRYNSA